MSSNLSRARAEEAVPLKDCSGRKYSPDEREDIIRYVLLGAELQHVLDSDWYQDVIDYHEAVGLLVGMTKAVREQSWYQDVVDFHRANNAYIGERPAVPPLEVYKLRRVLIDEEVGEVLDAMFQDDLVGVADGIADSIVVLLGTAISYGIDIRPIWNEVHRANMVKAGGPRRADGKVLKPEGWKPPDIKSVLIEQGAEL